MVSLYSLYASFSVSALCSAWFLCCSALKAGYIKSVIIVYMFGYILIIAGHIDLPLSVRNSLHYTLK